MRGAAVVMPAAPRFYFIPLIGRDFLQDLPVSKKPDAFCASGFRQLCNQPFSGHSYHATLGARLRELRWKNSAWLATADTMAGWNGLGIRNAGSGRSPVRKRSG